MVATEPEKKPFKPYIVEGSIDGENLFRIVEVDEGPTRADIEQLLECLPVGFNLRSNAEEVIDVREALNVHVSAQLIHIYPPRGRVIMCTRLDAWKMEHIVGKIHVDNLVDLTCPGSGQIRSCIHFDPKILGVHNWPLHDFAELEISMYAYPREKTQEPKITIPRFGKFEVRNLLELIAGESLLTKEQLQQWRDLIMCAVQSMRACYERPDVDPQYPVRVYYQPCWKKIDEAGKDDAKMIEALEHLLSLIQME